MALNIPDPSRFKPTSASTSLFDPSFQAFTISLPQTELDVTPTELFFLIKPANKIKSETERTPIVFLHGFPQNHSLWYLIARELEILSDDGVDLIIPDLPGYGLSSKTPSEPLSAPPNYSKRATGSDILALIDALYPSTGTDSKKKFIIVGHDRGARVGYRLALDYGKERLLGLCVMDIVPTVNVFEAMRLDNNHHAETFKSYHWIFLALPPPLPETMIGKDPDQFIGWSMDSWTGKNSEPLSQAHSEGFKSWKSQYANPSVLAGSLSDYRAGAKIDVEHDQESRSKGEKIEVNTLQLCSAHLARRFDVEGIWKTWVDEKVELKNVVVGGEGTGHFFPVEESKATNEVLVEWLKVILQSSV